ncbi:twitching motility protein PilT [Cupriavidus necator]|uniref:Twitching motility protein PilT n=1 Tax=Cupriavidus necator TaxID=106590 RepID=A0A2P1DV14_CUPNE|nr:twitching motility protein PilT [Cupriavidus necator]AVK72252.1 twitching motility protein PilT [Cupriavidus necator]
MTTTDEFRRVRLIRRRGNQTILIPPEFELQGSEAVLRREKHCLIIEPVVATPLRSLLAQWEPIDVDWPTIEDLPAADESARGVSVRRHS